MRLMLQMLAMMLMGLSHAPAPPYRPKPDKEALQLLQGEWIVTSRNRAMTPGMTAVIHGNRLKFFTNGEMRSEWLIVLDVNKNPRVFDRKSVAIDTKDTVLRGIYRLDGDTLMMCYVTSDGGHERPTNFKAAADCEWLNVLQRKKP